MNQSDLDIFIKNVLRVLAERGMSKVELGRHAARHCDYAPRTITSALNREFKSPAFGVCEGIAKALDVPMYLLLIPEVRLDLLTSKDVRSLFTTFNKLNDPALHYISSVAEREAHYDIDPNND